MVTVRWPTSITDIGGLCLTKGNGGLRLTMRGRGLRLAKGARVLPLSRGAGGGSGLRIKGVPKSWRLSSSWGRVTLIRLITRQLFPPRRRTKGGRG